MTHSTPEPLVYCRRCVMPTTRPGLSLDSSGLCNACRWEDEKQTIDWAARLEELRALTAEATRSSSAPWDCVVGVSGGKDSIWQACFIRDRLGLNPLLVQYAGSDGTELGRRNLETLVAQGFSLVSMQPNPQVARRLCRRSFLTYGNLVKFAEYALFSVPFRAAMLYDIPLVFFGENPALEAGDSNTSTPGWDATGIRHNNTLAGGAASIWRDEETGDQDLIAYDFPSEEDFARWGGQGLFLGYFVPWSGVENARFSFAKGMEPIEASPWDIGLHYRHNSLDSNFGGIVNSMLKHMKLGFGHTSEFASYDVRQGRATRAEAIALVHAFDGRCDERYVAEFCNWIDISVERFWEVANSFRGPMWRQEGSRWRLEQPIWEQEPPGRIDIDQVVARLDTRPQPEAWRQAG